MGKKIKKVLLIIFGLLIITIVIVGSINQAIKKKQYGTEFKEGKLYKLQDSTIYAEVAGNPTGIPVVLVSGLGDGAYSWSTYAPLIQKDFLTIAYDRGGTGRSGAALFKDKADSDVYEVKALLEVLNIEGPCILLGHSLGGATVRRFTQLFPEMVLGVVLVDTTNEEMINGFVGKAANNVQGALYSFLNITNIFGFPRLLHDMGSSILKTEIDEKIVTARGEAYLKEYKEYCFRGSYISSVARQFRMANKIFELITKDLEAQDIPAYIIYEIPKDEFIEDTEADVSGYIAAIKKQYPNSDTAIVYDAGHYVHVTRPDLVTTGLDWIKSQVSSSINLEP